MPTFPFFSRRRIALPDDPLTEDEDDELALRDDSGSSKYRSFLAGLFALIAVFIAAVVTLSVYNRAIQPRFPRFYANVSTPYNICPGINTEWHSRSGYIGLAGDSDAQPKRSFFW